MSGVWRVTVDSWISEQATWYGTTVYVVSGEYVHSLPAALQAIAESPPDVYLAEVARQEEFGTGPAPTEFNVPVCFHGRGRVHLADNGLLCTGPLKPSPERSLQADPSPAVPSDGFIYCDKCKRVHEEPSCGSPAATA